MKANGVRIKSMAREKSPSKMEWLKKECGKRTFSWAVISSQIN